MSGVDASTVLVPIGYALAIGLSMGLAAFALSQDRGQVSHAFAVLMVTLALWSLGALGRLTAPSATAWSIWTFVMYSGVVATAVTLLVFALLYTGHEQRVTRWRIAALAVVPAVSLAALATNPLHGQFYTAVELAAFGANDVYTGSRGPLFWLNALYSYVLLAVASGLLAHFAVDTHRLYRVQSMAVLAGVIVPWIVNAVYLLELGVSLAIDPTPLGFAVGGSLLGLAVFGARLMDVTPVARSAVVDAIDDAVIVVDANGRVVDLNPAARLLLEAETDPVGRSVDAVVPPAFRADGEVVQVSVEGADRWFRRRRLPLADGNGDVLLFTDLTDQLRVQRQLREQNRRLEEFASVAAHDLRNPLNAITGYVELARETDDVSLLSAVDPATDRMQRLIEDLLALGRHGRAVESLAPTSLRAAAERAWASIDDAGASLVVEADRTIAADEDRLAVLFEQLFLNAVDHSLADASEIEDGGTTPAVEVRVGVLEDGFYVADDGPGIDPGERDHAFEYGYATHDGTGLGLPIVRSIALAHQWSVSLAASEDGGLRVEVTDVDAHPG